MHSKLISDMSLFQTLLMSQTRDKHFSQYHRYYCFSPNWIVAEPLPVEPVVCSIKVRSASKTSKELAANFINSMEISSISMLNPEKET